MKTRNEKKTGSIILLMIITLIAVMITACGDDDDGYHSANPPSKWTAINDSTFGWNHSIRAIAYGDGWFVAGGDYGQMVRFSNEKNITSVNSTFGSSTIYDIAYGNGRFVAVGGDGRMAYSDDGINWTANTSNFYFTRISYVNNRFFAYGDSIAYSYNGIDWTYADSSPSLYIYDIAYGYNSGRYVAVGGDGRMAYSEDYLTSWVTVSNSTFGTSAILRIVYYNRFIAFGDEGKIAYSNDGRDWTALTDRPFGYYYTSDIAYTDTYTPYMVAVGAGGRIAYSVGSYYSDDLGSNWTSVSNSTFGSSNIHSVAFGGNRFVAVGEDGKMAYSYIGL